MPCFHPIPAFRSRDGSVVFSERATRLGGGSVGNLFLPCGQCVGCRLERSRVWAMRCVHEASLYDENCFVTLTYDDDHLPTDLSLRYRDFQCWLKRLRKCYPNKRIRFYMCGEYGENFDRPHFHACLFGFDFPDKTPVRFLCKSKLYRSATLERLWPFGFSSIGAMTFESAAYTARYIMKKITGDLADEHYTSIDDDGVVTKRVPEFCHMSLKPGIGAEWLRRFHSDVYPNGTCVVRGKECKPPRYYDKVFLGDDPDGYAQMLYEREMDSRNYSADQTDDRLAVREQVALARMRSLTRSI